jgi:hypothetical protein
MGSKFRIKHPVVRCKTTKKHFFTVNSTLLVLMLIAHNNKALLIWLININMNKVVLTVNKCLDEV